MRCSFWWCYVLFLSCTVFMKEWFQKPKSRAVKFRACAVWVKSRVHFPPAPNSKFSAPKHFNVNTNSETVAHIQPWSAYSQLKRHRRTEPLNSLLLCYCCWEVCLFTANSYHSTKNSISNSQLANVSVCVCVCDVCLCCAPMYPASISNISLWLIQIFYPYVCTCRALMKYNVHVHC